MTILEKYRDEVSIHKNGARWEQVRINRFLREFKGKITPDKLRKWRDERLKTVKATTLNRDLNLISAAYNHAIREWGMKDSNPVSQIKRPKNGRGRKRRISHHEFTELIAAPWRGSAAQYVPALFELGIETGMRIGELCSIEWSEVHEEYVHLDKTKNGDERDVPLSVRAKDIFNGCKRVNERVFPVDKNVAGASFRNMCKKLGIKDLHFHDTRHEAASRLSKKLSVLELAAVMGHRELRSLMVYYNPTAAELAEKMRR